MLKNATIRARQCLSKTWSRRDIIDETKGMILHITPMRDPA